MSEDKKEIEIMMVASGGLVMGALLSLQFVVNELERYGFDEKAKEMQDWIENSPWEDFDREKRGHG